MKRLLLFALAALTLVRCSDFYASFQDYGKAPPAPTRYAWHSDTLWTTPISLRAGFSLNLVLTCDTSFRADSLSLLAADSVLMLADSIPHRISLQWVSAQKQGSTLSSPLILQYRTVDSVTGALPATISLQARQLAFGRAAEYLVPSATLDTSITLSAGDSLTGHLYGLASIHATLATTGSTSIGTLWQSAQDGSEIHLFFSQASNLNYTVQNVGTVNTSFTDTLWISHLY